MLEVEEALDAAQGGKHRRVRGKLRARKSVADAGVLRITGLLKVLEDFELEQPCRRSESDSDFCTACVKSCGEAG